MKDKRARFSTLRWLVVLPAALAGALLSQGAIILGNMLTMPGDTYDSLLGQLFVRGVGNVVLGASMVWVASRVAPSRKTEVAMFMAGLFVVASVATWHYGDEGAWDVLEIAAGSLGALGMAAKVRGDNHQRKHPSPPAEGV